MQNLTKTFFTRQLFAILHSATPPAAMHSLHAAVKIVAIAALAMPNYTRAC